MIYKRIIIAVLVLALVLTMVACGKTAAVVTINDRGMITELEVELPDTVENILKQAEITLGEEDVVEPALTEKISEAGEIMIKRKSIVTLTVDGESEEVTIIGGTVADLLKQEGVVLTENQHVDHNLDEYITDGMKIAVSTECNVAVIHDGKTENVSVESGTVGDVLASCGVELGSDDRVSPSVDKAVSDGMEIIVKRVTFKEVQEVEEIDYETTRKNDSSKEKGVEYTKVEGQKGEKITTYKITLVDGTEESREIVKEEVTKEPVTEVIGVGTKEKKKQSSGSSDSGSSKKADQEKNESEEPHEVSRVAVPNCDDGSHGYYDIEWSNGEHTYEEY